MRTLNSIRRRLILGSLTLPLVCAFGRPSQRRAAHPQVRIVALGDSTTATARDWAPEIREVYADCLPGALAVHGITAVVINAGIGDTTTLQAVGRLDHDVRRYHPDLVVVQFGINDSWIDVDQGKTKPRLSRSQYRRNLRTIIRRILLAGDGIHPNQAGQRLVCQLLTMRIAEMLAPTPIP